MPPSYANQFFRHRINQLFSLGLVATLSLLTLKTCAVVIFALEPPHLTDFIQYWSASQLLNSTQNPYEPGSMLEIQKHQFADTVSPTMMWNPPWVLLFFAPVVGFSLPLATSLWAFTNVLLLTSSAIISWRIISDKWQFCWPFFLAFSFLFPIWNTVWFGQASGLLALASALLYFALSTRRDFLTGVALALFTIKPHVIYLVALIVLWQVLREKRYRILAGGTSMMAVFALWSFYKSPASIQQWVEAMSVNQDGAIKRVEWTVATLVGGTRLAYSQLFGRYPLSPIAIIPGITAVVALWLLVSRRVQLDWSRSYLPLACLSLFTSPYGWIFDAAMLIPVHLALVYNCLKGAKVSAKAPLLVAAYFSLHLGCYLAAISGGFYQHNFFFFSFAVLLFWYLADKPGSSFTKPEYS